MQKMGSRKQKKLMLQAETIRDLQAGKKVSQPHYAPTQPPICDTSSYSDQCTRRCC